MVHIWHLHQGTLQELMGYKKYQIVIIEDLELVIRQLIDGALVLFLW